MATRKWSIIYDGVKEMGCCCDKSEHGTEKEQKDCCKEGRGDEDEMTDGSKSEKKDSCCRS